MTVMDCVECLAVPGDFGSMIDAIDPRTGLTWYGGKTLDEVRAESERYSKAVKMRICDFIAGKAEAQQTPIAWHECSALVYDRMLECLPPALWIGGAFLVGEPADHDAATGQPRFDGFRVRGKVYERTNRPVTKAEFREFIKV